MTLGQFILEMQRAGCHEFRFRLDPTYPKRINNIAVEGSSLRVILEGDSGDYCAGWDTCLFDAAYHENRVDDSVQSILDAHRKHTLDLYAQQGNGKSE